MCAFCYKYTCIYQIFTAKPQDVSYNMHCNEPMYVPRQDLFFFFVHVNDVLWGDGKKREKRKGVLAG